MLKLYSYFRSSASYRVRIALHHKGLPFEYLPVHLLKDGGQQHHEAYRRLNPMGHVPTLVHDDFVLAESVAIFDYLDRAFPVKPLFPQMPRERAMVLQIVEMVNSGIQPLQNIKVTQALENKFGMATSDADRWTRHWIQSGLENLEKLLERTAGNYCFGAEVTAADCFLIPQCFSSRRFGVDTTQFPIISRIEKNALALPAFIQAHPEKQPDQNGT